MKKFLIVCLAVLPLVGCPKKKDDKGKQPDNTTQPADPDGNDSQPASNRAMPGTPNR
jgi:hypothetical protein